ncbi:MAG: hypothetical protein GY865_19700 [candidate division Zixibacteria bacterium]|nr:hypothetical protein [candidate division Zixibacteria bacterium]
MLLLLLYMGKVLGLFLTLIFISITIYAGDITDNGDADLFPYYDYFASTKRFDDQIDLAIVQAREELILILKDSLHYQPQIYLEDNQTDFQNRIGSAVPDWGAAVALPYKQMIVIKSPANFRLGKSLHELTKHEYSHLALEDRLNHVNSPRWLNEGLAMYIAFEWGWTSNIALSNAVIFRTVVPLRTIEKMNRFPEGQARIAYAQSYMAVKYLLEQYGFDSFNILLDNIRDRRSIDEALMAATGSNYDGFEKEYITYLRNKFNLLTIFIDMSYLWLFLAVVVIVGFFLKFAKKKKKYKEWDEYDKYHSTDFDYGDPDNPEQVDDEDKPWA